MPYTEVIRKVHEDDAHIAVMRDPDGVIHVIIPTQFHDYMGSADFSLSTELAQALAKALIDAAGDV